jgi:hypothetical protein
MVIRGLQMPIIYIAHNGYFMIYFTVTSEQAFTYSEVMKKYGEHLNMNATDCRVWILCS